MKRKAVWLVVSLLIVVGLLTSGFGCAAPESTPTPAPKPTPTPTPTPKLTPAPTSTPTPKLTPTPTTPARPFYEGKTLAMVVPVGAGGGADLTARLWARHLQRFIPGNPKVIVNNMPGAGSLIGSNYAYNAKPDGTTVLVGSGGSYMGSLFKLPEAKYDYRKMTLVIASIGGLTWVAETGNVDTPYDMTKPKKPWIFGTTPTGLYIWYWAVASEIMEIPTEKVLAAYTGAAAARMALFSGEINVYGESSNTFKTVVGPFVQKGELMPLFQTGVLNVEGKIVRDPVLPEIPTFVEIAERITGKPIPSGKALEAMKAIMGAFSFLFQILVPPGVPDEAVKTLWDACTLMIQDPAYQKDAGPMGSAPPMVWAGETVDKAFHSQFGMADETAKWVKDLVWEKYHVKPGG